MKQIICLFLLLSVLVQFAPMAAATDMDEATETTEAAEAAVWEAESALFPEEPYREPDQCGDTAYWSLDGGKLTIALPSLSCRSLWFPVQSAV